MKQTYLNSFCARCLTLLVLALLSTNLAWGDLTTYEKVTSAPTDWSGTYIMVFEGENNNANICKAGVDAASNFVEGTISSSTITGDFSDYEIEVATYSTGYSIKALGGTNSGKYLQGQTSDNNGTTFVNSASSVTTFSISDGVVTIANNSKVFAYNSNTNNYRWRFFKSGTASSNGYYKPCFYKKGTTPVGDVAPSITTQPQGATYEQNASATALSIEASGNPEPTYQWYSNTTNSTLGATAISGATNNSYTPSTQAIGTTYYYCVATNSKGSATSDIVAVTITPPFEGLKLEFDLSENNLSLPTSKSTSVAGNYTYKLNEVNYIFSVTDAQGNTDGGVYFSSSYTMVYASNAIGFPNIPGYKLVKVEATNSGSCSTTVNVGISSSSSEDSYISGGDAKTWNTQSSTYTYNLSGTSENTVYYLYVTNKNAQLTKLTLTYEKVSSTDVTITAAKYATLGLPYAVTIPEGVSAYTATVEGTTVTMTKISGGVIPANCGVILYAEAGDYTFTETADVNLAVDNKLVAVVSGPYTCTVDDEGLVYYLGKDTDGKATFKKLNENGTIAAGKAYLKLDAPLSEGAKLEVTFGEPTGIESITPTFYEGKEVYNLNGMKVNPSTGSGQAYKGIVIVNGKKYMNK